jgi:hypothetical protein
MYPSESQIEAFLRSVLLAVIMANFVALIYRSLRKEP